jgi:hypothetical protein
MVTAYQYEKMTMYILLDRPKSDFPGMDEELSSAWDSLAVQIEEIHASGGVVEIVTEMLDFE